MAFCRASLLLPCGLNCIVCRLKLFIVYALWCDCGFAGLVVCCFVVCVACFLFVG